MAAELPPGWSRAPLSDIVVERGLIGGPFGSSLGRKDYVAAGIPVIRGSNLATFPFDDSSCVFVTEQKAEELSRSVALPGDIVVTQRGTLGQVGRVPLGGPGRWIVSQSQMALRIDDQLADPRFVLAVLRSPIGQRQINENAIVTGVPHINLGIMSRIVVPLPPLIEQVAIADSLDSLDEMLQCNRRLRGMTHELVQLAFDQRFGRDVPAAHHGGRPAAAGMSWGTVGELVQLHYGRALPASERRPGPVAVVGSSGTIGTHDAALTEGPAVVVGRKGHPGSVVWVDEDAWPIDTTFYAVPTGPTPLTWLYFALRAARLNEALGDSAVPGLNRGAALARPVVIPPVDALDAFDAFARPLFEKRRALFRESKILATIHDALLPKLVSGQIRVPLSDDPEEQVGAAVQALA